MGIAALSLQSFEYGFRLPSDQENWLHTVKQIMSNR